MKPKITSLEELDMALKNSFTGIKRDINDMKRIQGVSRQSQAVVKKQLEVWKDSLSKNYVSNQRFDAIKLRMKQVNENLKRLWQLEKTINKISQDSISLEAFDKEMAKNHKVVDELRLSLEEFKKDKVMRNELDDLSDDLNKRYEQLLTNVEKTRDVFDKDTKEHDRRYKKDLAKMNSEIRSIATAKAQVVDVKGINRDIKELDSRLNDIRDDLGKVSVRAEENISQQQIDLLVKDVSKEINQIKGNLRTIQGSLSKRVTQTQVEALVSDTNKELDKMKAYAGNIDNYIRTTKVKDSHIKELSKKIDSNVAETKDFFNRMKEELLTRVSEAKMKNFLKDVNSEFNRLNKDVAVVHEELDRRVNEDQIRNFISDLNKEFDVIKEEVASYKDRINSKADAKSIISRLDGVDKSMKRAFELINTNVSKIQGEKLVEDVNNEFTVVRKEMKKMNASMSHKIGRQQVENMLEDVNNQFSKVDSSIRKLEKLQKNLDSVDKTKVSTANFTSCMKKVDERLDFVRDGIVDVKSNYVPESDFKKLRRSLDKYATVDGVENRLKKFENRVRDIVGKAGEGKKLSLPKYDGGLQMFGNALIFISFLLLVASIVAFIVGKFSIVNTVAIGAIVTFLVGILVKIFTSFR